MATTTNYSWTTPDDTALVKDGAAAIRSLGTAIDSTVFTNAGAAIAKATVDAKGDLIAGTADNTVARLAVGANDTVLIADSSTATGLKWGAAAASIPANATDTVATANDVTSNTYTDPVNAGPAVTLTTGTKALVIVTSSQKSVTAGKKSFMGYAVSGATTIAATDTTALAKLQDITNAGSERASAASVVTLTAGSNTFTAKYKTVDSDISTFTDRTIFVMNLA
jgi:hypothetical protein